jgi:hypothetical protein
MGMSTAGSKKKANEADKANVISHEEIQIEMV